MGFNTLDTWKQFGKSTLPEIAGAENEFGQRAYAWLYKRIPNELKDVHKLPGPLTDKLESPPTRFVPVVQVANNTGILGFLAVDEKRTNGEPLPEGQYDEYRSYAYNAAKFVFDLFRMTNEDLGEPDIELELYEGGGTSLSLPAMFAALGRILGITWDDTIISTGLFENGKLKPVPVEGLNEKIDAAKRFGYKTLVVVEGQKVPEDCPLTIMFVPTDPVEVIFKLIELGKVKRDRNLARFLFAYDQRQGRNVKTELIEPFLKHSPPLVKHIANDILSRNALHHGKTAQAKKYREAAETLHWENIPNGYLGHYLRYESIAAKAVLEIDLGNWNVGDNPIYIELDKRLNHLQQAISGGHADRNDYVAALALANARALWNQFRCRLSGDMQSLEDTWNDFMFLFEEWPAIVKYTQGSLRKKESILQKQRNYCIGSLADYWQHYKTSPQWKNVEIFLATFCSKNRKFTIGDAFDKIAELNALVITGKKIGPSFVKRFESQFPEAEKYPHWILYENVLRFYPDTEQKNYCLDKLEEVLRKQNKWLLDSKEGKLSMLTLLMLRTRQILKDNGREVSEPVLPPEGTQLRQIAEDLLSDESTLIQRCPY